MELSEALESNYPINHIKGIKEVEYTDDNGIKHTKKYIKGAR